VKQNRHLVFFFDELPEVAIPEHIGVNAATEFLIGQNVAEPFLKLTSHPHCHFQCASTSVQGVTDASPVTPKKNLLQNVD